MNTLKVGKVNLTWLSGGIMHLDGGAMFGVVPKALWEKKYPCNKQNQIELSADPILIQVDKINFLVDSGLGNGKLTDKQKRNFGVVKESQVAASLELLGLSTLDIDYVLMTHLHFDHACGLTKFEEGIHKPVFPNAKIITSRIEWDEMREPNIRSKSTYWRENWEAVAHQVVTFADEWSFGPVKLIHTGGHSNGHCIVLIEDGNEFAIHMADILPTHAHQNVLWVLAYDDYPIDSIAAKQKWLAYGLEKNAWFLFYHDAFYHALKWGKEKNEILESV